MKRCISIFLTCIAYNVCNAYTRVFDDDYGYHHNGNGVSMLIAIVAIVFFVGFCIGIAASKKDKGNTQRNTSDHKEEKTLKTPTHRHLSEEERMELELEYLAEMRKYNNEKAIYDEAMKIRKKFVHGGVLPGCMGEFVKTIIYFLFIPCDICLFVWLSDITAQPFKAIFGILGILSLWYGYKLIIHKLGDFFQHETFDGKAFEKWCKKNPNSPYTWYVRHDYPPSKPMKPTF